MERDNFARLFGLLIGTWICCGALYWLPETWMGYRIKRVDLLSDLREKPEASLSDSLVEQWELEWDSIANIDSTALLDSLKHSLELDSAALLLRDSLYRQLYATEGADSLGLHIEDYSLGHVGLKHFFDRLAQRETLGRPVRIGVLGDSFIEGDILVADLRAGLQKEFGGCGVGFVPINSVAAQYRPTIQVESEGWKTHSLLTETTYPLTLSGLTFEADSTEAMLHFHTTQRYPGLEEAPLFQFIYESNRHSELTWTSSPHSDTLHVPLPPTAQMSVWQQKGSFQQGTLHFKATDGLRALGFVLEDSVGISVDNFSLRGHSGLKLAETDSAELSAFQAVRPYDLLILQYGLNVVNDSVMQYGWYGSRMVQAIQHLQHCLPETDLLLLSVSDRSWQNEEGTFETMPAVLAMVYAQRKTAQRAGIAFWNLFGAMGGENSMIRYVENNWASKDYTHLGFRGGKEIAQALLKALLTEKAFYDEAKKMEP